VQNTLRHGLPDDSRTWSLEGRRGRKKKDSDAVPVVHVCDVCFLAYTGHKCPACGLEQNVPVTIEERDGELVQVSHPRKWLLAPEVTDLKKCTTLAQIEHVCVKTNIELKTAKNILKNQSKTLDELQKVGRMLGYKPGWAVKIWTLSGHQRQEKAAVS
jgi:hypothetical protein